METNPYFAYIIFLLRLPQEKRRKSFVKDSSDID